MKQGKRIRSLLLAAALCLSLCGCNALDEARAAHAIWQDDGTIRLGDTVYKRLPDCEELTPDFSWNYYDDTIYLTDPDVPVLASSFVGQEIYKSTDGIFLEVTAELAEETKDYWHETDIYCRSDYYESAVRRIEIGFTADKCVYYYEKMDFETGESEYIPYTLTTAQRQAVEEVLNTVVPTAAPEDLMMDYCVSLLNSSDDLLFTRAKADIVMVGDTCYLLDPDWLVMYLIPEALQPTFADIMETSVEAEKAVNDYLSGLEDDYSYDENMYW